MKREKESATAELTSFLLKQPDLLPQLPHHIQFSYVQSVRSLKVYPEEPSASGSATGTFTNQQRHHAATARSSG
eukprot:SAG22_NODE_23_length_31399_cov_35.631313_22_plen_74_part_00